MPVYIDYGGNYYYTAGAALNASDEVVINPSAGLVTALSAVSPTPKRVIWGQGYGFTLDTAVYQVSAGQAGVHRVLLDSGIPFILAGGTAGAGLNQLTVGNNGALTTIQTLNTVYDLGAWFYMPANGIFAGSTAGWYWFVGSSTTAGTLYNHTYTSGDPKAAAPSGTPTAFVSTGPGVVTQTTNNSVGIVAQSITVPGGSLGPNGSLHMWADFNWKHAGTASLVHSGGFGVAGFGGAESTNGQGVSLWEFRNRNNAKRNYSHNGQHGGVGNSAGAINYTSIDTTVDQAAAVLLRLNVGDENSLVVCEGLTVEVSYGA